MGRDLHLFGFSPETLHSLIEKAGFSQVNVFPSPLKPNLAYLVIEYSFRAINRLTLKKVNLAPTLMALATKA